MKVLYLYTELLGYNLPIFEQLVNDYDATVDVIHWSQNKLTPFLPSEHTDSKKLHFMIDLLLPPKQSLIL